MDGWMDVITTTVVGPYIIGWLLVCCLSRCLWAGERCCRQAECETPGNDTSGTLSVCRLQRSPPTQADDGTRFNALLLMKSDSYQLR